MAEPKRSRWQRVRRIVGRVLVGLVLFLLGLVVVLVLALNTAPVRELVRKQANQAFAGSFAGQVVLERVGSIDFGGVSGVDARVVDTRGRRVAELRGATLKTRWLGIVWSALRGGAVLEVPIDAIECKNLDLGLFDDGKGGASIASAFAPRSASPPSASTTEVRVAITKIRFDHIWVHGALAGSPPLDADLADLEASFRYDARALVTSLRHAKIRARALPYAVNPSGTLKGRLELAGDPSGTLRASGAFQGLVAETSVSLDGGWDGTKLNARLDAPSIAPEVIARRVPSLTPSAPSKLHVKLDGPLADLVVHSQIESANLRVAIDARAHLEADTRVSAKLRASGVNVAALVRDAPPTDLAPTAELTLTLAKTGDLAADIRAQVPPGRFEGAETPSLSLDGHAVQPSGGTLVVTAEAKIEEPSAPTRVNVRLTAPAQGDAVLHATLKSNVRDAPRLATWGVHASGSLAAEADWNLTRELLSLRANAAFDKLAYGGARAERLELAAKLEGNLAAPHVNATLSAGPVVLPDRRFERAKVTLSGRLDQADVRATLRKSATELVELTTRVRFGDTVELESPEVAITDSDGRAEVGAARVSIGSGGGRVDDLVVRGVGTAEGDVVWSARRQELTFTAVDLDLVRLARFAGVAAEVERALVSVDAHVVQNGAELSGRLSASAREVVIKNVGNVSASVDLTLERRKLSGTAKAELGRAGSFAVELDELLLPQGAPALEQLETMEGAVVARGELRLADVVPLLRAADLPIERAGGTARFDIQAQGDPKRRHGPRLEARIETRGLTVTERRIRPDEIATTEVAREVAPEGIEGIDLRALVDVDPAAGTARAELTLFDRYGTLTTLGAETKKLPADFTRHLSARASELEWTAKLDVPRRGLATLPKPVRPATLKGVVELHAAFEGSWVKPRLEGWFGLDRLRTDDEQTPVDVKGEVLYERAGGKLALHAARLRANIANVEANWRGDATRLVATKATDPSPVQGEVKADVRRFPMETIPVLFDRQLKGAISADLHLKDFGRDARVSAKFDASGATLGKVRLALLRASIETDGARALAKIEGGEPSGKLEAKLETAMTWGNRLVPTVVPRLDGKLTARSFRLDTLSPLLIEHLNEIGGRLDADMAVRVEGGRAHLTGSASVKEGVLQVPALGQRLTDIKVGVTVKGNQLNVNGIEARGTSGKLRGHAWARFDDTGLVAARSHLGISKKEALPLTIEGADIGDAYGRVDASYQRARDGSAELRIDVPSLHIALPEETQSGLQSLEDVESIRVGVRLSDGKFAALPVQPLESGGEETETEKSQPLLVRVRLGKDVVLERGRQVKVRLGGEIAVLSGEESRVSGRLELRGGTLDVSGKTFEVERGVITFDGVDPSNPTITATARWDSPAGFTVYAEYRGDVKNGKLSLRSEPPLTQDEIASLLLFGSPDGSSGSSSDPEPAAVAVGVAGDTAAQGLNRMMSDLTNLDVGARIDTSTGSARPELVVQLTPRLAARITRAVGDPPAGQPPDRTFLTLELRLKRSWAISAVVGDHGGSGMDLIWRRRY